MKSKIKHGSDPEKEALALFAGRPSILEAFLDLTEKGSLAIRWDPLKDPIQWETDEKPTEKELERIAAMRVFYEKGFIMSVTDNGLADFTVIADDWAIGVRKAFDNLPSILKEKIREELSMK